MIYVKIYCEMWDGNADAILLATGRERYIAHHIWPHSLQISGSA